MVVCVCLRVFVRVWCVCVWLCVRVCSCVCLYFCAHVGVRVSSSVVAQARSSESPLALGDSVALNAAACTLRCALRLLPIFVALPCPAAPLLHRDIWGIAHCIASSHRRASC